MTEPISRQQLEDVLGHLPTTDGDDVHRHSLLRTDRFFVLASAAQAILDGEPLEWCVVHGANKATPEGYQLWCWRARLLPIHTRDCQFESQIRVKVGP